jgi:hypothetical protein
MAAEPAVSDSMGVRVELEWYAVAQRGTPLHLRGTSE